MIDRSTETDRSDPRGIDDTFFRQLLHYALEADNLIGAFLRVEKLVGFQPICSTAIPCAASARAAKALVKIPLVRNWLLANP